MLERKEIKPQQQKLMCVNYATILALGGQRISSAATQTEHGVKTVSIIFYMSFPLQILLNQMP
jgi:hypothetical protein